MSINLGAWAVSAEAGNAAAQACRRGLGGLMLALQLVTSAAAADLYVSPTGDDSVSRAQNSAATPWRTIGRAAWGSTNPAQRNAAEAAQAGDRVLIAPGTYASAWSAPNGLTSIYYNPTNSGRAGAPIRFQSTTGQRGAIVLTNSGRGALIGASDRSYIEWADFRIEDPAALSDLGNTGKVIFFGAEGGSIENSILRGSAADEALQQGDNWSGVRLNESMGQRIVNNIITDFGPSRGDENNSGITTYQSANLTIEHNEFARNGAGIYLKGNYASDPTVGWYQIRYNRFTDHTYAGIYVLLIPSTQSQPNVISQNILVGNRFGVKGRAHDGEAADMTHLKLLNNTIIGSDEFGVWIDGDMRPNAGIVVHNNIIQGNNRHIRVLNDSDARNQALISFDRNLYSGSAQQASVQTNSRLTWAQWQALGQDVNGRVADPQFGPDYRVSTTSPALGLGRARYGVGGADGAVIPAGAYITGTETIGLNDGATPPPPPPPPTPVDCVGTWSAWTRQTGSDGACVNGSRTYLETRAFTVTTMPSNGGLACPASPEMRTQTEPCAVVPPPSPLTVTATGTTRTCTLVANANQPPDTASGWGVQFARRIAGDDVWTNHGTRDTAGPYTRSASVALGQWEVRAVWSRTGSAAVTVPAIAVWNCEP